MDQTERDRIDAYVSAVARLALWLVDELEPNSNDVLEADLDDVYALLVLVERRARAEGRIK